MDANSDRILISEFSTEFVAGMKKRMVVSFHKYGPLNVAYPHKVDAIGSMRERLRLYASTGNTEYLIDAANFAMIEFMLPRHPDAHFTPTDDSGSPGRVALKTGRLDKRDNEELPE